MIRDKYQLFGVDTYCQKHGNEYVNPHENIVREHVDHWMNSQSRSTKVLDLCCGSGEVTSKLIDMGFDDIIGCDPYTNGLYVENTGKPCLSQDFKSIAIEGLKNNFDIIICSFALHLCDTSMLPTVLYQLSVSTKSLIVITPNKKPNIECHFTLHDSFNFNRVKSGEYRPSQ